MKSVFVLTYNASGPCGHGEPGIPYRVLLDKPNDLYYELGDPAPAFATRSAAEKYLTNLNSGNQYTITELELIH